MGKSPIDQSRPSDSRAAREYARVEREQGEPMSDPKVKSMTKAANKEGDANPTKTYARVEREQADPVTDPKVKAMTKGAHKDEDKAQPSRLRKFLNILRQSPDS